MGWRLIETAPKDGTPIDVWCVVPDDSDFEPLHGGVRFTDVSWHDGDGIAPKTGWMRVLDDGDWDFVEFEADSEIGCPPWIVSHWQPLPEPPEVAR